MRRILFAFSLLLLPVLGISQTTTYTGTIKDLTGAAVTSGRITWTLKPGVDSTITGLGRFVSSTVSCLINASGNPVSATDGTSPCVVTQNSALTPTGTSYYVCIQPSNITPGSCFYDYATTTTKDISTIVPTPSTGPVNYGNPTGPQGLTGAAGPAGGSLSYPGVTSDSAGGLSTAATVFNVRGYGATGNGSTDDSSAINAAITALNTAGAGVLYFPVGNYYSASCGFTLSSPTIVEGAGVTDPTGSTFGSMIKCGSTTAVLFTVTANSGLFENISLWNTAGSTPTAGAAIFTNSSNVNQRINYQNLWVSGFYDGIHVGVGSRWVMTGSEIDNVVRRGLWIQNTLNSDAGDWVVVGNEIASGPRTQASASAGVYQDSSGGGKLIGNKINASSGGNFQNGFYFNLSGSVQGQVIGNNIETTSAEPIYFLNAWPWITITDNMLIAPTGFAGIYAANGMNNVYIGGGTINSLGTSAYAINLQGSSQSVTIMPFGTNPATWTTAYTNMVSSGTNINNANLSASAFNGVSVNASTLVAIGASSTGGTLSISGNSSIGGDNWACNTAGGIGLDCQSSGGAGFTLYDNSMVSTHFGPYAIDGVQITTLALSDGSKVLKNCGSKTTTAATSDTLACSWVTTSSTCSVVQSNATSAAFTSYSLAAGVVTLNHAATAGAIYSVACSVN